MLVTSQELDLGMFHGVEGKIQHHEYSSFGVLQSVTDENGDDISANPKLDPYFTYTGREFDKETGLYYYRARYYDANTGRFLQVDPDAGTMISPITHINKYSYVGNNPINMIDPSGLRGLLSVCTDFIGYAFGGVAYVAFKDKIRHWATEHRSEILRATVGTVIVGGAILSGAWVPVLIGAAIGGGMGYLTGGHNLNAVLKGAAIGAIGGGVAGLAGLAFAGSAFGLGGSFLLGAGVGAAGTLASSYVVKGTVNWKTVAAGAATGGLFGMVASGIQGSSWFDQLTRNVLRVVSGASSGVAKTAASGSAQSGGSNTSSAPSAP